jgi:hypothetical protein
MGCSWSESEVGASSGQIGFPIEPGIGNETYLLTSDSMTLVE